MGIVQIGARLIRSFGSGENLRKVVTETVNGTTFTRVLNSGDKILLERAKKIIRNQQVGNKKVNTVTKVISRSGDVYKHRLVYDRVYGKEGKFLGSRATFYDIYDDKIEKNAVLKNRVGGNSFVKWFSGDNNNRVKMKLEGHPAGVRPSSNSMSSSFFANYNNKGLPIPQWIWNERHNVSGKSLKEMRDLHMKTHPETSYARECSGLDFLDKPTEGLATMNDLDKFI